MNEIFTYDYNEGVLIWNNGPFLSIKTKRNWNLWRSVFGGTVAGTKIHDSDGVCRSMAVRILGRAYSVHRIVWEMHNGAIPSGMFIDHIDGDPFNNRLCNLRLATPIQNANNRALNKRNTSGKHGVSWDNKSNKWRAQMNRDGKRMVIGWFEDLEDAAEAYSASLKELHGEFSSQRPPIHVCQRINERNREQ